MNIRRVLRHGWRQRLALTSAVTLLTVSTAVPAIAGDDAGDMPNRIAAAGPNTSLNWAGWAVQSDLKRPQDGVVTQASGEWTVPAVDCSSTPDAWSSVWVGIDGFDNGAVQQVGTAQACSGGQARYFAFYQTYPNPLVMLPLLVRPGDVVTGDVRYVGALNLYMLTLTNRTLSLDVALPVAIPQAAQKLATRRSAGWIAEAPSNSAGEVLPLANFGAVTFTNATVTLAGKRGPIADPSWEHTNVVMVSAKNGKKADTSGLNAAGNGFTVFWRQSQ